MSQNFKFYNCVDMNLLVDEFIKSMNKANSQNILQSEILIVNDSMFEEYLKYNLLKDEYGIVSNLKIYSLNQFINRIYILITQKNAQNNEFSQSALRWRILDFLKKIKNDQEFKKQFSQAELKAFAYLLNSKQSDLVFSDEIAKLFSQYQSHRPDWLQGWQAAKSNLDFKIFNAKNKSFNVQEEEKWQPLLWNYLYENIMQKNPNARTLFEIHQLFNENIHKITDLITNGVFPNKITIAGITNLSKQNLEVFTFLAKYIEVNFLYQNPSQAYWLDAKTQRQILKSPHSEELSAIDYGNPLLLAWGQEALDFLSLLEQSNIDLSEYLLEKNEPFADTLLGRIQNYIYDFVANSEAKNAENSETRMALRDDFSNNSENFNNSNNSENFNNLEIKNVESSKSGLALRDDFSENTDNSIKFTICHTPMREVEVLYDQIIAEFEASEAEQKIDPQKKRLEPRDILVLVSDMKTYAPLIKRVFDAEKQPTALDFKINDLFIKNSQELVKSFLSLLETFAGGRFTSFELMQFLYFPPLAKKFEIEEQNLENLKIFIENSNIRWGLDCESKQNLELENAKSKENTWLYGLERMLLGLSSYEDWSQIQPLKSSFGKKSAGVGGLMEFVKKLIFYQKKFAQKQQYFEWVDSIDGFLSDFYELKSDGDLTDGIFLKEKLQEWQEACELGGLDDSDLKISFKDFLFSWTKSLEKSKSRQIYFGNFIHFCEFVNGRNIPYKKIFILGLEDGAFPHSKETQNKTNELFTNYPRIGDKSKKQDDKYAFLQTILLAQESLYFSWVGKNNVDDKELSSSVLISQFRKYIKDVFSKKVLDEITFAAPLHSFDINYFKIENNNTKPKLKTYSQKTFQIYDKESQNSLNNRKEFTDYKKEIKSNIKEIDFKTLVKYLKSPIDTFFEDYLKINKYSYDEMNLKEEENFKLDALEKWQFKNDFFTEFDFLIEQIDAEVQNLNGAYSDNFVDKFIEKILNEKIDNLFTDGKLFKTPFAINELKKDQEEKQLQPIFKEYLTIKTALKDKLILNSQIVKLQIADFILEVQLPDIYYDSANKNLEWIFLSTKEMSLKGDTNTRANLRNTYEFALMQLILFIAKNQISELKNLEILTLKANLIANLKDASILKVESSENDGQNAEQILAELLSFYPQPLTAFSDASGVYLYELKGENAGEKADKAQKQAEIRFKNNLAYSKFATRQFDDFDAFINAGFIEDSKNLYKPLVDFILQIYKKDEKDKKATKSKAKSSEK